MNYSRSQIAQLLLKEAAGQLTAEESEELANWKQASGASNEALRGLNNRLNLQKKSREYAEAYQRAERMIFPVSIPDQSPRVHRVHFLRRWGWVAAVLVAFGGGLVLFNNSKRQSPSTADRQPRLEDIAPGGEKAILTLGDGRRIVLDSAANGQLADQGGVQVIKLANGQIAYDLRGLTGKEVMWNTMTTPKGGQYQLTLPDGTKVWLNAASSITFPTAFLDAVSKVKISGEVYFEVARNKQKPFLIDVNGRSSVEILGTSFNINAYENEEYIRTTVAEGSVRVNKGRQSAILKPGQQAAVIANLSSPSVENAKTIEVTSADLDQTLAWKNGLFNFNGSDLRSVMRQLERWYDIRVEYEGSPSDTLFSGKMYMNVNLSDVLEMFKEMGIRFRTKGNTLIVSG